MDQWLQSIKEPVLIGGELEPISSLINEQNIQAQNPEMKVDIAGIKELLTSGMSQYCRIMFEKMQCDFEECDIEDDDCPF